MRGIFPSLLEVDASVGRVIVEEEKRREKREREMRGEWEKIFERERDLEV